MLLALLLWVSWLISVSIHCRLSIYKLGLSIALKPVLVVLQFVGVGPAPLTTCWQANRQTDVVKNLSNARLTAKVEEDGAEDERDRDGHEEPHGVVVNIAPAAAARVVLSDYHYLPKFGVLLRLLMEPLRNLVDPT